MKKSERGPTDAAELRRRAEERLKQRAGEPGGKTSPDDAQRLVHELQVHQIELEMQNEELERARAELEAGLQSYSELYDFAPVGYLTLGQDGDIRKANLTGARLLRQERSRLVGGRFALFVADDSRSVFDAFLKKVFESRAKQTCDVVLQIEGGEPLSVHIEAAAAEDGQTCRAVLMDITELKRAEESLARERGLLGSVMQATDVMLVYLNRDFNFVWVNEAYANTCNYRPEEMVGKNHFVLYPNAENEAIFRRVRDTGEPVFLKDKPFEFPDQPDRGVTYWDWSLSPVKSAAGHVNGLVFSLRETTKFKEAELALRESEELSRQIIESSSDCIKVLDLDGRLLSMSQGGQRLLEIEDLSLYLNVPWQDFWKGAEHDVAIATVAKARAGDTVRFEGYCPTATGTPKWWEVVISPIRDVDGRPERLVAISRDVTERRTAEVAIHESEARLQRAQEMAHLGSWEFDLVANRLTWSDEVYRIFGLPPGEEAATYEAFLDMVHPEDRAAVDAAYSSSMREGRDTYEVEHRIVRRKTGEIGFVHQRCQHVRDASGQVVRSLGMVRDITDQRQQAEALRKSAMQYAALIRTAQLGYFLTDLEGTLLEVNEAYAHLSGYSSSELLGMRVSDLEANETPEEVRDHIRRVRSKGFGQFDTRHRRRDGTFIDVEIRTTYLDTDGGRLMAFVADISERRTAERERQGHLAAIEEANETKDLFLNTLSHELRTPLAAMLSSVEVLKRPESTKVQRFRLISLLERNVRHQTRLIDDLLDLSRIMRRKVEIAREPLDLREVVTTQVEELQPDARRSRLAVAVHVPQEPVLVLGDVVRLSQVITNLLTNAIKFTKAGGEISVLVAVEGEEAVVRVRDTGIGISSELLPHIFDAFRQAETSLARSKGGLGIGLAIARSLAEMHGGTLEASSDGPGQGSELILRLPRRPEQLSSAATGAARTGELLGLRVLLVEDGADLLESMTVLLELMGHTVVTASDGKTALEVAGRERPDVALIDIGLPDMDGYDVARRLRADASTRDTRLIALTGYATSEHRERALQAGFNYHLAKPVDADHLRQALEGGEFADPSLTPA